MFSASQHARELPDSKRAVNAERTLLEHKAANPHWSALAQQPVVTQSKLAVGASNDALEQAAESTANDAMSTSDNVASSSSGVTQRPTATIPPNGSEPAQSVPPVVHQALHSPSSTLDTTTRAFMESRLGGDFSHVRVHTNPEANRANNALQSRAFTSGNNVALGTNQYSPGTPAGKHLIAHELAHVLQQRKSGATANTVQRAPALSGHKTTELIDDSIAGDVDAAIAASATLKKYIDPKTLRKISGHVSVDDPNVFEFRYKKYAKSHSGMPDVKDVPGYTDRSAGSIELKQRSADLEAIIHEAVHFNSQEPFSKYFGHAMNEGMTEYFTEGILAEQKLGTGRAYRSELQLAKSFVASVGEAAAAKAYFVGDQGAYKAALTALNKAGTFSAWRGKVMSDKAADWTKAADLLKAAMGQ